MDERKYFGESEGDILEELRKRYAPEIDSNINKRDLADAIASAMEKRESESLLHGWVEESR